MADTGTAQREMTDEEMDLAQEVHAHNLAEDDRCGAVLAAAQHLELPLVGSETTDADGRRRFDVNVVLAAIKAMGMPDVEAALAKAKTLPRGLEREVAAYADDLADRRMDLLCEALVGEVAAMDDVDEIRRRHDEVEESRSEIEMQGRYWYLDASNATYHRGYARHAELLRARLDELVPSPHRP